jgi:hypothetical protein
MGVCIELSSIEDIIHYRARWQGRTTETTTRIPLMMATIELAPGTARREIKVAERGIDDSLVAKFPKKRVFIASKDGPDA